MSVTNLKIVFLVLAVALAGCSNSKSGGGGGKKPVRTDGQGAHNGRGGDGEKVPPAAKKELDRTGSRKTSQVDRITTDGNGQDKVSDSKQQDTVLEVGGATAEYTTNPAQDRVVEVIEPQEFRLNRKPILTPPPKRADNEVPWFDQNKPYKSVLKTCGTPEKPCPKPEVVLLTETPPAPPPEVPRLVFDQPLVPHTKALDILFVVDTSDSLDIILGKIVSQIGRFVDNLPPQNDYNIAVMLAHSPESPYASVPFTLSYGGDVEVLKSKSMSLATIREKLRAKIAAVKNHRDKDSSGKFLDGQGELGTLAVQNAINNPQHYRRWADAGFFREDAGLTIVFVADEQDVCFDYSLHPDLKPHYTPNIGQNNKYGRDEFEARAFEKYCKGKVSTDTVLAALRSVKRDHHIILTGILFKSEAAVKRANLGGLYRAEYEMGHGYLDLITAANGEAVELADDNFGDKMAQLGLFSNIRLSFVNKFEIKQSPQMVKCTSIEVTLKYPPASRRPPVEIASNQVWYEEPYVRVSDKAIIKGFIPGTKVEITYKWADTPAKRECTPENTSPKQ